MKELLFFIVLIIVLGVGSFLYRNTLEAPTRGTNATGVTCDADARACPDGTAMRREGPSCEFAACPLPNVSFPQYSIAFAIPAGYLEDASSSGDTVASFTQTSFAGTTTPNAIAVSRFPIPDGQDANDVMLARTTYEESGAAPSSMEDFTPIIINGKTFQTITVDRFEGQVHTYYYLPRANDVLRFSIREQGVADWTDSSLNVRALPGHAALESLLATLQSAQ